MFFKYGGMNMKILASGNSTTFCVTVKRDKSSDPAADEGLQKIVDAVGGAMRAQNFGTIGNGYSECSRSWHVPRANGEVLASRLNLVSTLRVVSYSSVLDAISAASRA